MSHCCTIKFQFLRFFTKSFTYLFMFDIHKKKVWHSQYDTHKHECTIYIFAGAIVKLIVWIYLQNMLYVSTLKCHFFFFTNKYDCMILSVNREHCKQINSPLLPSIMITSAYIFSFCKIIGFFLFVVCMIDRNKSKMNIPLSFLNIPFWNQFTVFKQWIFSLGKENSL